jgi:HSP20 family protein
MRSYINGQWECARQNSYTPEANILELDDRFLLEIALPGVVLDDVELKAEEFFIVIRAKRLPAPFEEEAIVHAQEMPYAFLIRNFEFDMPILAEQVEARMDRGILYISVPKLEIAHRIPVSAGSIESRLPGFKTHVVSKNEPVRHGKEAIK